MMYSETIFPVRYYETDQMGIVHHSNYIRYFECARNVLMAEGGYPIEKCEEDGVTMDIAFTIGINGKWDASLGTLNIELSQNSVHCSIDKIDAGDEDVNALIQMGLSDSEVKEELLKEMKDGFNVDDFNGSLELDFKNDNSMVLTDNTGEKMVFHRK